MPGLNHDVAETPAGAGEVAAASSDELVAAAVRGDKDALAKLIVEHHAGLLRSLRALAPRFRLAAGEAEDVLQEVYIGVFADIGSLRCSGLEGFLAWMKSIVRRRLIDWLRYVQAAKRGGRAADREDRYAASAWQLYEEALRCDPTPSKSARSNEWVVALRRAVALLKPAHREVFRLRYLESRSPREIAEQLGRTVWSVECMSRRALTQLRHCFAPGDWLTDAGDGPSAAMRRMAEHDRDCGGDI